MKSIIKNIIIATAFFGLLTSCSSDDDTPNPNTNEIDNLIKIQELSNEEHTLELYSKIGVLEQGYNAVFFRIKNNTSGEYFINNEVSAQWNPVMHMMSMQHSCPKSEITKTNGKQTLLNGYIVFQMASNTSEYWVLTIDYSINGNSYSVTGNIEVFPSDKQRVASFMGADNIRYVLALIEPQTPSVAVNDMVAGLFRMENMMTFSIVDDYTIKIDPRMPSMGNHGSPNNVDLTQGSDNFYHGKLSLTMTGYWKINLQLLNQENEFLKGEEITAENQSSSLYLEVEF